MSKSSQDSSPFTQLVQIGVVVRDIEKTVERLESLGIGPFSPKMPPADHVETYRGQPFRAVDRLIIKAARMGNIELELVQPLEGGSPHREFLEEKGEGIQHVAFPIEDIDGKVESLIGQGCTLLLDGRRGDGGGVAYIDLDAAGIIIELLGRPHSD